jgi:cytidine deaminase
MRQPDYGRAKAEITSQDISAIKPWALTSSEFVTYFPNVATPDAVLHCLVKARQVRPKAESYRGFNVGACGLILRHNGMHRYLSHGANLKSSAGEAGIDVHAEEFITGHLKEGDTLAALAVVAPLQPDSASGKETPTLHPCYKCRERIQNLGEITAKTLIITATPDVKAVEWGSIDDYIRLHAEPDFELAVARFEETPDLFKPTGVKPGQPIELNDELDVDSSEWDRKITFPLLEWIKANQILNT